jgi:hypothetical protein
MPQKQNQSLNPTPSKLRQLWELATTPLAGEEYSIDQMYEDPRKIMSPERVMGMVSSPLDLLLEATGLGALSKISKGAKAAKIATKSARSVRPRTAPTNQPVIDSPIRDPRDPIVRDVFPNPERMAPQRGPVSLEDAKFELIMKKLHGQGWQPRAENLNIPKELLDKHKITYPPPPRNK